ncbi:restriction endonuclease subunit S [Klebsiella pneumoniae]|uniref:restriction endonuclease subunit S n=1 Tax=Klebsiella TaxID=570 RepID=UPI001BD000B1|nr:MULTISPECIES: restriction endonuclease subunit S [Klebsiella]MCX2664343.1 restriction endonuclease subunit S [Klebsiella pneumoniae]MDZ0065452.1 restriction endonuclease subunit S [Klebsiella pneumoniae]MDZ0120188.1 restriction endonuclease subunit S [Klebsiella pneumoniae]MDZ0130853.1 restriction endonuclease subunit S [Klebsiella pneumoniae]MDZ0141836.1 restriction endonuclease subunit S [Klebsiella pneumoniae]
MSELSYLEKLLDGTEVEWKALGDVTSVLRGKRLTKNLLSAEEKFPVFHGGLEPLGYYNKSNRPANTVMIINVGASAGTVGYSTVDFWSSDGCFCLEHNELLNNRFLYFALIGYQSLLKSKVRVAGIPTLDAIVVNKLLIPIPCPENPEKSLAIQLEIVRVLDKFTALTAELTAELTARKKQYNYYRDQLLSFEDGEVEWVVLGNLVDINTGSKPPEIYEKATDYDYINAGTSRSGYSDESNCEGDTVTTPSRGQGGIGYVGYQKKPFWLGPLCYKFRAIDEELLVNKYLFYFLQSRNELLLSLKKEGGVPAINKSDLVRLEVPVPPLVKQQKIVDVLDNFYTLITSITEGLPREIELRQKQYEYYRDLLFSFPKPDSVTN